MNFTFVFSDKELDYIANTLAQRPWHEVNALLASIQAQVQMAQQATQEPRQGTLEHPLPPQGQSGIQQANGAVS